MAGGDATTFAREAAESGFDVVIAGGGDGTINEVARGPVEGVDATRAKASLGILPLGTANDLAHACGIPINALEALHLAVFGEAFEVDVGRANGKCFMNMATGGFGAKSRWQLPIK